MAAKQLLRVISFVVVVHLGVLSFVFGPRRIEYALAAYFSAVFVWGIAFFLGGQRRVVIWMAIAVTIVIQQAAYHMMEWENFGFWWPLTQFFTVHFILAGAAGGIVHACRAAISGWSKLQAPR